ACARATIMHRHVKTSIADLGQTVGPILGELEALVKEKKGVYAGGTIFVYHGDSEAPAKKVKLEVSFAVEDGTEAQGNFKVRRLEPFKCRTVLYGGPISS